MMHYRPLPFEVELQELRSQEKTKEAFEVAKEELRRTINTRGWQLVLSHMRILRTEAMNSLGDGVRPEYFAGQIRVLDLIESSLSQYLQLDFYADMDEGLSVEDAGEFDTGFESPFAAEILEKENV